MPKYRKTICTDPFWMKLNLGTAWGYQPVDLRKKYFTCINCNKEHLVKENVIRNANN